MRQMVLSRHRLPRRYRYSIAALWLTPILLLTLAIITGKGLTPALLDLRYVLPVAVLTIPSVYIWQEGVDVLTFGIRTRNHIPRYHDYAVLDSWYYDRQRQRCILTIWDKGARKVLECHAGHLSDLPLLLDSLRENIPSRDRHS